jgi:hypothetical protein
MQLFGQYRRVSVKPKHVRGSWNKPRLRTFQLRNCTVFFLVASINGRYRLFLSVKLHPMHLFRGLKNIDFRLLKMGSGIVAEFLLLSKQTL